MPVVVWYVPSTLLKSSGLVFEAATCEQDLEVWSSGPSVSPPGACHGLTFFENVVDQLPQVANEGSIISELGREAELKWSNHIEVDRRCRRRKPKNWPTTAE